MLRHRISRGRQKNGCNQFLRSLSCIR